MTGAPSNASHSSHVGTSVPLFHESLWVMAHFGIAPFRGLFVDKASNGGFDPSRHIDRKAAASLPPDGYRL